ncbi:DNA helicase [Priestia megaterium]|nr:DNA helicase [Priestia megaterium]
MTKVELITERVGRSIVKEIQLAKSSYILTSFVMDSGVKVIERVLRDALEREAEVKLLAGDYLFVTQPQALQRLIDIHPNIEVRLWQSRGKSFHPKAYIFESETEESALVIGSSNLSASALTTGVEWSLKVQDYADAKPLETALEQFLQLFYHDQTIPVNTETIHTYKKEYDKYHQKHPFTVQQWTELEEQTLMLPDTEEEKIEAAVLEPAASYAEIKPRPVQENAIQALYETLEEGYKKAMVVMATGLGKTYLAGFFARNFHKVLFIAHREEILTQAKASFEHIMPHKTSGLYYGKEKHEGTDFLFASIYTLSRTKHLHQFKRDEFDLIVVDEFHHAAAATYQKVISYFKPQFLLGITATPDRMDQKDIYALCDGNVAYQLHFIEGVQKGWLVPFHYYGVYDETDYSAITWLGTKYDREELLAVQLKEEVAANILEAWKKHKQTRTLCFCSSIEQANFLADYFYKHGFNTVSLHSKTMGLSRKDAIKQLELGQLDVIFTVDLFNEGVDIPSVDTLLMVRPTESLTIFTQQVGRGLRLHPDKDYCTIIDLIGNYRNADIKLQLFHAGDEELSKKKGAVIPTIPANCQLQIDTKAIALLKEFTKKRQPRKEQLKAAYIQLKQELGRRPMYIELHRNGNEKSIAYKQEFKSYAGFLNWAEELSDKEQEVFKCHEDWLIEVEKTTMIKSYKMIVLKYMLSRGPENWLKPVTPEEAAPYFHRYLTEAPYRKKIDFSDKAGQKLGEYDEKKVAKLIATMPMTKWSGSAGELVEFDGKVFTFNIKADQEHNQILYHWTEEICEYRLGSYFEKKSKV